MCPATWNICRDSRSQKPRWLHSQARPAVIAGCTEQLAENAAIMKAVIHGRGPGQSSALMHAIGMTVETSAVVGTPAFCQREDVVNEAREPAHPFVDVIVLQLNEASADGGDVALLVGEGDAAGSLRVLQLRVGVDAGVADAAVQPVHDHRQLHWGERGRRRPEKISAATESS